MFNSYSSYVTNHQTVSCSRIPTFPISTPETPRQRLASRLGRWWAGAPLHWDVHNKTCTVPLKKHDHVHKHKCWIPKTQSFICRTSNLEIPSD